jgi:hypothetical protein
MRDVYQASAMMLAMALMAWSPAQAEEGHTLLKAPDVKWSEGPPSMSPGAKIAVIEGDLKKAEPFTFRLKLPSDYKIAPHTHPAIEHVTVISGTLYMGPGDKPDPAKTVALAPGSYAVFQPGHSMFAYTKEETVIQVHGVGPWGINYINPADDPRKK